MINVDLLTSLCKNGLPTGDLFEFAAIQVLKYERKWKQQQRVELQERIMRREKEKELKKLEQRKQWLTTREETVRGKEEEAGGGLGIAAGQGRDGAAKEHGGGGGLE